MLLMAGLTPAAETGGGASSPENLVKQVLSGLETKDEQSLKQLIISSTEFKKYIWPTLATAASNGGKVKVESYYVTYMKTSDLGLADRLKSLGGQKWELMKVSFGPERRGKGYRILPRAEAVLRGAAGEEKTVPIAGVVLDEGGTYKVATYYVREVPAGK
jgi:hypothetical protein